MNQARHRTWPCIAQEQTSARDIKGATECQLDTPYRNSRHVLHVYLTGVRRVTSEAAQAVASYFFKQSMRDMRCV